MKNYKITCPSIFIATLVADYIRKISTLGEFRIIDNITIINKTINFSSSLMNLDNVYGHFAGTPFDILIQELDDNGNLVKQRMTP